MSLVGNLEDLSLGDIMQIISLSQKSGVLALEGDDGSGRIVFRMGLVHAACVKGQAEDLRGLLVGGGLVDVAAFDEIVARARELGLPEEEAIAREGALDREQIDSLLRESIEAAILEMFSWMSGDFSFDVRNELEPDDPRLLLASGINAQYLAMEGMRIRDERSRDESVAQVDPNATTSSVDPSFAADSLFGDDRLETEGFLSDAEPEVGALEVDDESSAADTLVATVVSREDGGSGLEPEGNIAATPSTPVGGEQATGEANPASALPSSATRRTPVVLIDPDVSVLEWVKTAIQGDFARVHVFQQAEQGLARIRQYLIRGELPVVLLSTEIRVDPLSGIHGLSDFVERLKTQAARLVIVGLHDEEGSSPSTIPAALDGVVVRPGDQLRERAETVAASAALEFASALQQVIVDGGAVNGGTVAASSTTKSSSVRDLRDATGKLQKASSRGEILPVVLEFAAEIFARVAILIVREEQVFAIAGRGIDALEVDPLDTAPPVSLQALDSGWIRQVIQSGEPFAGPLTTSADRELLARLGGAEPSVSYLGPIESGGSTIALLYGDQASDGAEMPDTSGLEVVLHHAGLALDRAALERALWEADAGRS
jgi:hypothetical protein